MQAYGSRVLCQNVEKIKGPQQLAHLGSASFKETAIIGSGYSGDVKRVQDENGSSFALKISFNKQIRFSLNEIHQGGEERGGSSLTLPEASEFEKLRKLYTAGVPVPRPHGFQLYTNAEGHGNTALLMELIKGSTLRDWLSDQPGGKADKTSGRSLHPAVTYLDGIARVDVAIAVLGALLKLRRVGFFADLKPRNIMIREQRHEQERHFSACLVDIGGVVLNQDLSTNSFVRGGSKCSVDKQPTPLLFRPVRDRYLIETTCSYLSPEMALIISEYDFWKGRLGNHFFKTRKEVIEMDVTATKSQDSVAHGPQLLPWLVTVPPHRKVSGEHDKALDLHVASSYLRVRQDFETVNILQPVSQQAGDTQGIRKPTKATLRDPNMSDLVVVTEKSSVFTMGLMIVELFGGKRTGLTSLTRLKHVMDIFLGETGNAEFRMVMEWEKGNTLLQDSTIGSMSNTGTFPSNRSIGGCNGSQDNWQSSDTCASTEDSIRRQAAAVFKDATSGMAAATSHADLKQQRKGSNSCRGCSRKRLSAIPSACFFDIYRRHAYPTEGVLAAWPCTKAATDCGAPVISEVILNLLDSCLRFTVEERPSLMELLSDLQEVRRLLFSRHHQQVRSAFEVTTKSEGSVATSKAGAQEAWTVTRNAQNQVFSR